MLVYRAGLMSLFGHNHVIASYDLSGTVTCGDKLSDTTVALSFPVSSLSVDRRELRDIEGAKFSKTVSDKDIDGTRKNMLGDRLLNAEKHALVQVRSSEVTGVIDDMLVTAEVTVAGKSNSISFLASAVFSADTVIITGTATVRHDELGLKPFSAAFGTLKVQQALTVRFEITAVLSP